MVDDLVIEVGDASVEDVITVVLVVAVVVVVVDGIDRFWPTKKALTFQIILTANLQRLVPRWTPSDP